MAIAKTQKKLTPTIKKVTPKKANPKKGSLEAINKAFDELRKNNVDLTYVMTNS
jgi:hypothetical protein